MSGGVDSSVAAALLKERGLDVVGLTMKLHVLPGTGTVGVSDEKQRLGGEAARRDAGRVAAVLGIPFHVADFRRAFEREVVAEFVAEYARGRTPNPCLRCNRFVKFELLRRRAARLGAGRIATGHYARIDFDEVRRRWRLLKAVDSEKDQSYFLYGLRQEDLARTLFPLGGLCKTEVRKIAVKLGLPAAERPESQEICFVPGDDYAAFLRRRVPKAFRPGPIVDRAGRTIGRHEGFLHFTIGQRKGMGIAAAHPLYVVSLDAASNTVVAGPNEALFGKTLVATDVNWVSIPGLEGPRRAEVKIRSRHEGAPATLRPAGERAVAVEFDEPQRAITPGQAAVFYDGDSVLGGGLIWGRPKITY
ncbi:MAG: tRNA 2-thiouridine(34) synthase MnmA [Candidatus Aminicenantes bacterium]|nr:tRNA 2-thiouridine(34) synthase MnmA [Candidatus Aminicenantes bacterium]